MPKQFLPYELSKEADKDIEDIFDYTEDKFGADQAIVYVMGFEELSTLCLAGSVRKSVMD